MISLRRSLSRLIFHAARFLLRAIEPISARLCMRAYLSLLRTMGVRMAGCPRYIALDAKFDDFDRITFGDRVVISQRVILLTHDYSLTAGLRAIGEAPETDIAFIRPITLGDNVFVGMGATLLPGTVIGDDVVVAAGSVVRGTVEPDSIVAGNPAQVVGRLSERAQGWKGRMEDADLRVDKA